jgi:fatty acid desaturase
MRRIAEITIWTAACLLAGAAASRYCHLDYWWSSLVAAISLILNGFFAEWEDRGQCTKGTDKEDS